MIFFPRALSLFLSLPSRLAIVMESPSAAGALDVAFAIDFTYAQNSLKGIAACVSQRLDRGMPRLFIFFLFGFVLVFF